MTDAALVDDNMPPLDPAPEQVNESVESETPEASAPQAEDKPVENDGFQKRINKVTAEKYAEKRKAEALQRQIDDMKAAAPQQPEVKAPTLEDFDYDEAAFQSASISHQVKTGVAAESQRLQQQSVTAQQVQAQQAAAEAFDVQVAACTAKNADYQEKVAQLPQFNADTLGAIMASEQGADLAYELAGRLDLADEIANASPMVAAMKLGELSAQLKAVPNIKPSAAPAPIEPVSSGGALSKDVGEMSMAELYNS
jgi:hypothetical protein